MKSMPWALALALAIGLGRPCQAGQTDPWTREDTLWELAYVGVVALDCNQSMQLKQQGRTERNPFLPRRPGANTILAICVGSALGHAAVSYALPAKWRRRFQVTTVVLEVAAVTDNHFRAGIRFTF